MTPVKARPIEIQTADSIAASLMRDDVRRAVHEQQVDDDERGDEPEQGEPVPRLDVEVGEVVAGLLGRRRRSGRWWRATGSFRLMLASISRRSLPPRIGTTAPGPGPNGVDRDDERRAQGYSPSTAASPSGGPPRTATGEPSTAWAAASRAIGTRNGEQLT